MPGIAEGVGLSSDFISGFCGETDAEHQENLSLLREIGFDQTFTYAYSKREQTYAGLFMTDDVEEGVKSQRLQEMIDTFQRLAIERNIHAEIGRLHVVLVEGDGKDGMWTGRTDTNKRVIFAKDTPVLPAFSEIDAKVFSAMPVAFCQVEIGQDYAATKAEAIKATRALEGDIAGLISLRSEARGLVEKGSYVIVKIAACRGHTLRGVAISITSLANAYKLSLPSLWH